MLTRLKTVSISRREPDAEEIRQPVRARAFLWYAIGKELEDLEDWEHAFEAISQGAAMRRSTLDFDAVKAAYR